MTDPKIIPEQQLEDKKISLDGGRIFYFKFVGIGHDSLAKADDQPVPVAREQQGFFLACDDADARSLLHAIVDRACNQAELP